MDVVYEYDWFQRQITFYLRSFNKYGSCYTYKFSYNAVLSIIFLIQISRIEYWVVLNYKHPEETPIKIS